MDIFRTLNSILAPGITPVNRARPAVPVTETEAGPRTFAQTLEDVAGNDPSIAPFGVRGRRPAASLPEAPVSAPRPEIEFLAPLAGGSRTIFNGATGPTLMPDNPAADQPAADGEPKTDLPIDQLHVEIGDIGDTMGSVFIKQTEVLSNPEPILPPPSDPLPPTGGLPPVPNDTTPPTVSAKPPVAEPPKAAPVPPMPIPWPTKLLQPSGATGPGIQTTQAAVDESLAIKCAQYTNPRANGIADIGVEGRLFLDAINKGYVPATPEGLGTLLSYLSMGDIRADGSLTGRDPAIAKYFGDYFSPANAANV